MKSKNKIITNTIIYHLIDSFLDSGAICDLLTDKDIPEKAIIAVKKELENRLQKLTDSGIVNENTTPNIFKAVLSQHN